MSNPFEYDLTDELRKPLTKYQALKLAVAVTPLMDEFAAQRDKMRYTESQIAKELPAEFFVDDERSSDEIYLSMLFNLAEQILEKDAKNINDLYQSDKQLAYDEIMTERQKSERQQG